MSVSNPSPGDLSCKPIFDADGQLILRREQSISQAFIDELKDFRQETSGRALGNHHKVASIPTIFVEKFKRDGFDVFREKPRDVLKYLRAKGLDAFITTDRSL